MQPKGFTARIWLAPSRALLALLLLAGPVKIVAGDFLDHVARKLSLSLFGNKLQLKLSGTLDLEAISLISLRPVDLQVLS